MTEPDAPTPTEATEYTTGGDMTQGTASAHVETAEEIAADPISDTADVVVPAPKVETYKTQHAKVLRFELSIGADDDDRTIEQFETDMRLLLLHGSDLVLGEGKLPPHNTTTLGAYYIIDGKVCLPVDYDAVAKNRKPGTYPPVWAGGPTPAKVAEYLREESPTVAQPVSKPSAPREEVAPGDSPEEAVAKLAGNMTNEVKASS